MSAADRRVAAGAPVVDVIMPAFNAARFIEAAIQSVLNQTHLPGKIIIVDDGSDDNTIALVKGFHSELIQLIVVPHGGVSYARNIGIRASSADYVAFLDSDDLWLPQKLERQLALMQQDQARAGYSRAASIDEQGRRIANLWEMVWGEPHRGSGLFEALLNGRTAIMGSASSVIVERAYLLQEVGLFDEHTAYAEDLDLWLRIASKTAFVCVDAYDVQIRENPASATRARDWEKHKRLRLDYSYVMNKYARDHVFPARTLSRFRGILFVSLLRADRNKIAALRFFYVALRRDHADFARQLGTTSLAWFAARVLLSGTIYVMAILCKRDLKYIMTRVWALCR